VSAGYKKTLYQACTFLEDGMWPPKRWEIESGHIRIFLLGTGRMQKKKKKKIALAHVGIFDKKFTVLCT
jgi:hypothetical protein